MRRPLAVDGAGVGAHEPLHARVPTHGEDGRPLSDFMMLFPGLRERPRDELARCANGLGALLGAHDEVVFADLNIPLNLLWVSVLPKPGIITAIASSIQQHFPEALLVASKMQPD